MRLVVAVIAVLLAVVGNTLQSGPVAAVDSLTDSWQHQQMQQTMDDDFHFSNPSKPEQRWIKPSLKAVQLGDPCTTLDDCVVVSNSQCDAGRGVCVCTTDHPIDGGNMCGQVRMLNESCHFNAECLESDRNTECRQELCQCTSGFHAATYTGGNIVCTGLTRHDGPGSFVDPTMIGVLIGLVLMFIIMCVVLRLFSKARFRENRTIFNTPNPRLANASLLKEVVTSKGQQGGGSRRSSLTATTHKNGGGGVGSSRQPSLASIPRSIDASVSTGHSISRRASLTGRHHHSTGAAAERDAPEAEKLLEHPNQQLVSVHVDQVA